MSVYTDTVDEGILTQDFEPELYQRVESYFLAETFYVGRDLLSYAVPMIATDNVGISQTSIQNMAVVLADIIGTSDSQALKTFFNDLLTDRVGTNDTLFPGLVAMLADGVGTNDVAKAAYALAVIDILGLTEALAPALKYGMTVSETAQWMDSLSNFFSGVITEGIGTNDALTNVLRMSPVLAEILGVNDALTQKLVFRVDAADGIGLDDFDIEQLRYAATIAEGIEIVAGYIGPNGNFTTWAINTKNFATTEYTNYVFNSFAQMGNQYLGATSSGLFELDGATDNGAAIIADIKSGLMQLGGSRFTSFKAAYLGVRGAGDFVLKLVTGDGTTYNYAVVGKSMQTTKVHFGKGLRARYFSFELISAGQDFDLDTIEFIPLVAQRRV